MNQILSVEEAKPKNKGGKKNKGNSGPLEIKKVVTIFVISTILFGISLIGSGSYSIYKNTEQAKVKTKPIIVAQQITEDKVQIRVTHDKQLSKVLYSWNNDEEQHTIEANGKNEVVEEIPIPSGDSVLNIYAEDVLEQSSTNTSSYILEKTIDIQLEADGTDLTVSLESENELSYMTYRWDDGDEQTIGLEGTTQGEQKIQIPEGEHTLTIVVVDIYNQQEKLEQPIKTIRKPKLDVTTDGADNFIIKASDEQGIKRIEFIMNENNIYGLDYDKVFPLEQRKEIEYKYPLHDGENLLTIRAYSESGEYKEITVRLVK